MPENQTFIIEPKALTPGLTFYRRADGIFVFVFRDMTPKTVTAWAVQSSQNDRAAYQARQHIRTLYDMRGHWILSPYMIAKAVQVAEETPNNLVESIAVLGDKLTITVLGGVIRRLTPKVRQSIMVFTREDDALLWFAERVALLGAPAFV
ncbi:MAG: hypothetical protein HXY40_14125 [Chloroflexi bacterium]|nr:hypothetical protein [Chloroflexota bacterium]